MSRLIDADTLIADMEKRYCKDCERRKGVKDGEVRMLYEIGEAPCRACGTMDAMDEIDNAPTIEVEPVRWINMDEDEPLLGQKVLVYRAQKPVEIMSMLYLDNEYWWRNYADEIFKVYDNDYWMPLPEPPKGVSE